MADPTDPTENPIPPPPAGTEAILAGRKIIIVVSEDWYFCSHRLPLGKALHAAGAEVIVATRVRDHGKIIEQAGLRVIPIGLDRSGLNPLHDLGTLRELLGIYRRERPDLVHHVALKPTLYGALCARLTGVPAVVNALAGLGYLFSSPTLKARLLRPFARLGLRALVNRRNSRTILQNPDDIALFESELGARPDRLALIRGSGVDTARFRPHPPPDGAPVAVCVSRMLWDKGIDELVEAARLLQQRGTDIKIRLVGPTDENPASIPQATLDRWRAEGIVDLAGPSPTFPANTPAPISPCCPPTARACRNPCSKRRPAAGRWSRPTCPAAAKSAATTKPACSSPPAASSRSRTRWSGWRATPVCAQRLGTRARQVAEAEFAEEVVIAETLALYRDLLKS